MLSLIIGVALGVAGKLAYDRLQRQDMPADAPEYQRRAAALLDETRHLLGEIREEVTSATDSARERAGGRLERLRQIATSTEVQPPASGSSGGQEGTAAGNGASADRATGVGGPGMTGSSGSEGSLAAGVDAPTPSGSSAAGTASSASGHGGLGSSPLPSSSTPTSGS